MKEAIVIGAGPAGCTAAIALAQRGIETQVLERGLPGREKLCAGGLPPKVVGVLPTSVSDLVERSVDRIHFQLLGSEPFQIEFTRPLVHMVDRTRLDERLMREVRRRGVETTFGLKVRRIGIDSLGALVETDRGVLRARVIIACDGALGAGASFLGREGVRLCPTLQADIRVPDRELLRFEKRLVCDFGVSRRGIGWIFPKADRLSVGVCAFRVPADLRSALGNLIELSGLHPLGEVRPRSHPLPVWDGRRVFSRGPVLVAGDAAGLVNPLTGAGIRRACVSGQLAAEAVAAFLIGGGRDPLDLASYDRRIGSHLVRELRRARFFARIFYRTPAFFHRLGVKNARINPWVEELLSGRKSYHEVFRELFSGRWLFAGRGGREAAAEIPTGPDAPLADRPSEAIRR